MPCTVPIASIFFASTPASSSCRRFASTRSRKSFTGNSLCPGARAVRNSNGYFSRTGSDSFTSRNKLLGVCELSFESGAHFFAHFVAASLHARSNRRHQVSRIAPEVFPHLADTFLDDALDRAAPACVKNADSPPLPIRQNDGKAIGSLHGQEQPRRIRDHPVSSQRLFRHRDRHRWIKSE